MWQLGEELYVHLGDVGRPEIERPQLFHATQVPQACPCQRRRSEIELPQRSGDAEVLGMDVVEIAAFEIQR